MNVQIREMTVADYDAAYALWTESEGLSLEDDDTQAILMSRGGVGLMNQNAEAIRQWVRDGGMIISEYNASDDLYNAMFEAQVPQGNNNGSCQDNLQPVVQFNPMDPFWAELEFEPLPLGQSGCGFNIAHFPEIVALGGWAEGQVQTGYRDLGAGRVWLVDADWQDGQNITELSLDMMALMIRGL